jgi:glycosyltransferase involved in cell wall biosynthesis
MKHREIRVACVTTTLSSAAGGLSASVPNLAHALARSGQVRVSVVGLSDPADPGAAAAWGPVVHPHDVTGPRAFGYAGGMSATLGRLDPDVIDVQGLWTYPSLAALRHQQRHGTPCLLTPHGMLDPWARERSRWKKRVVRLWFQDDLLARAVCLRATAEMEAGHFRSYGLHNPIAIVPNGVDVPSDLPPRPEGRRRLLFLSRIHPKKGIDLLLRAWAGVEAARSDWDLVIAGPDEVGHTDDMQDLARRLGLRRVEWLPAVHGVAKSALYRSADCFVLPTHAENFGLVVAEALAHEVPVITTRNAPWEGLLTHRCGWWINLDETLLRQTLEEATSLPRPELWAMGVHGRAWMARDFGWDGVAEKMLEVYRWVISGGDVPECVTI